VEPVVGVRTFLFNPNGVELSFRGLLMSTYRQILYHIVFSTKHRTPCLTTECRPELFAYTWGILRNKNCHLYRINGVDDHIHILTDLHPTIAIASLIKDIKVSTSTWIKQSGKFPSFRGWQTGYGAFTLAWRDLNDLIDYVKGQEEHHKTVSFIEEFRRLIEEAGLEFDERDME
jgi:REP element-mobilizing transposase RayT